MVGRVGRECHLLSQRRRFVSFLMEPQEMTTRQMSIPLLKKFSLAVKTPTSSRRQLKEQLSPDFFKDIY